MRYTTDGVPSDKDLLNEINDLKKNIHVYLKEVRNLFVQLNNEQTISKVECKIAIIANALKQLKKMELHLLEKLHECENNTNDTSCDDLRKDTQRVKAFTSRVYSNFVQVKAQISDLIS